MKGRIKVRVIVFMAMLNVIHCAHAGALGRSDQSISPLFEDGQVLEYYQGFISPDVQGQDSLGGSTGGVSKDYVLSGAAYKTDIDGKYALAVIVDQPWGADFEHATSSQLYGGTRAEADSLAISGLLQRRFSSGFSLYGGPRLQQFSGELELGGFAFGALAGYTMESDEDWEFGHVVGVSYSIPAYAIRTSVTYSS